MKNSLKFALFGACMLAPLSAVAQEDLISLLFDKATELFDEQGFAPTNWVHRAAMAEGLTEAVSVKLEGGTAYQLVGVCDSECGNLDLEILDSAGKQVAEDVEDDDSPIIAVPKSGKYTLNVTMMTCAGTCKYGVISFKK